MAKYPAAIPTLDEIFKVTNWVDWVKGEEWNDLRAELRAVLVELGTLPKGASADVKTRLGTLALKSNVLELDNVTPFTPDADHEPATKKYVDDATPTVFADRGDPAVYDYELGDLTTDEAWHDLNLSGIVPVGAKVVSLKLWVKDNAIGSWLILREKGNENVRNVSTIRTQVADIWNDGDAVVICDDNRIIEYLAQDVAWTNIQIIIKGWWF